MHTYMVTVTATDRVGIVHSVTGTIRDQGGNILELSQTVMRDFFTIILAVEFPEPRNVRTLSAAIIANGGAFFLNVEVIDVAKAKTHPPPPPGEPFIPPRLGSGPPGDLSRASARLAPPGG